jgi:hypothetical protein
MMAAIEGLSFAQEFTTAPPGGLEKVFPLKFEGLLLLGTNGGVFVEYGEIAHQSRVKETAKRLMHRLQFKADKSVFEIGNATTGKMVTQAVPGLFSGCAHLTPVKKDVALVGVQFDGESVVGEIHGATQILEAGERIAIGEDKRRISFEIETFL